MRNFWTCSPHAIKLWVSSVCICASGSPTDSRKQCLLLPVTQQHHSCTPRLAQHLLQVSACVCGEGVFISVEWVLWVHRQLRGHCISVAFTDTLQHHKQEIFLIEFIKMEAASFCFKQGKSMRSSESNVKEFHKSGCHSNQKGGLMQELTAHLPIHPPQSKRAAFSNANTQLRTFY